MDNSHQPINQPINQPMDHSFNQSTNQSVNDERIVYSFLTACFIWWCLPFFMGIPILTCFIYNHSFFQRIFWWVDRYVQSQPFYQKWRNSFIYYRN